MDLRESCRLGVIVREYVKKIVDSSQGENVLTIGLKSVIKVKFLLLPLDLESRRYKDVQQN
jgi:hypothetical protein